MFFVAPLNLIACIQCVASISMVDLNLRRRIHLRQEALAKIQGYVHPDRNFDNDEQIVPIAKGVDHCNAVKRNTVESYVDGLSKEVSSRPTHHHIEEYFGRNLLGHVNKLTSMFFKLSRFCVDFERFRKKNLYSDSLFSIAGSRSAACESKSVSASWMACMYSRATADSPPSRSRYVFQF